MTYPTDEETFDARNTPEWIREGHLNSIQQFLKRIQDFLGYGGRLHDKAGKVLPVGSVVAYPGTADPDGWLLCNGRSLLNSHADNVDLFAVIGYKFGEPFPNHFNLPDYRGYFLRGSNKMPSINFVPANVLLAPDRILLSGEQFYRSGVPVRFTTDDTLPAPFVIDTTYYTIHSGIDSVRFATSRALAMAGTWIDITTQGAGNHVCLPWYEDDKDIRLKLSIGGNDGEDVGSYEEDAFDHHYHYTVKIGEATHALSTIYSIAEWWDNGDIQTYQLNSRSGVPGHCPSQNVGGNETRPRNVFTNYIIKR